MTRRRKIVSSGASRDHATREFTLLPGGADLDAPPDETGSEGWGPVPRPSLDHGVTFLTDEAASTAAGQESEMRGRPSWVTMDRFALADTRRAHRLTPMMTYLLDGIVRLAEWHAPHLWDGTLYDLGEFTGLNRSTIASGLERLKNEGLVAIHRPCHHGGSGLLEVLVYDELVVDEGRRKRARSGPVARQISDFATNEQDFLDSERQTRGSEGGSGSDDARVPPTRDRPALGAYRKIVEAFPGAEEVS